MDTQVDLGDLPVDTSAPVLVTGATGYVAGWIVKALLHQPTEAGAPDPQGLGEVPVRRRGRAGT
ncbi:hypothetical protein [Streptomyces sp. SCA2-2]|uniref:hypothetical protein n=1 Tax=Streptomyces sp. SCA2-2 TaxID=1563677 RepID=UPI00101FB5FF|nr:hypothetical protein [Streptomyces sp. SCA2-2]RZF05224.1 hypothetical protein C0L86_00705 [Streptomyces sp. SCA2-2]